MALRAITLSAALLLAPFAQTTLAFAQSFPPAPADQRRAVGGWLVEHRAEPDGGRIVRMTRLHDRHVLEYHVSFWRGNGGPFSHASVEQADRGCGSEAWRRDPASDLWRPETDIPAVTGIVRARLAEALAECGAGQDAVAAALGGFEAAFALASAWAEVARLATLAEMEAIATDGQDAETPRAARMDDEEEREAVERIEAKPEIGTVGQYRGRDRQMSVRPVSNRQTAEGEGL